MMRFLPGIFGIVLLAGCSDPVQAPIHISEITVDPQRILSGGETSITSPVFAEIVLLPARGPEGFYDVPNRWSNFVAVIGSDTVDAWRTDDTTIALSIPPLLTGEYQIEFTLDGGQSAATIDVVGAREMSYWPDFRWPADVQEGYPVGAGELVVYSPGLGAAAMIALNTGDVLTHSSLRYRRPPYGAPRSRVPGASYRPGHAVLNLRDTNEPPRVWSLKPQLQPLDTIACYDPDAHAVDFAEIAPGRCLGIFADSFGLAIRANGTTPITPADDFLSEAFFVVAPGGRWTVPVTREWDGWFSRPGLSEWFIFDQTPSIAFRTDRYSRVTGAAFSATADTLFITADRLHGRDEEWVVEALDPATGALYWAIDFEFQRDTLPWSDLRVMAVYPDLLGPYLYVASAADPGRGLITIIDRTAPRIIGVVETPRMGMRYTHSGVFAHGGSAGVLYFFGWCGWDCDANITPFDLDYDLFESLAAAD